MPFLTVPDGTCLYYEEMGAGDPLLLIMDEPFSGLVIFNRRDLPTT